MEVISVGNCGFDHGQVVSLISQVAPSAKVRSVDSSSDAVKAVGQSGGDCALVLVNRVFDRTQESGLALVEQLKSQGCAAPIMLISNYPDAQQQAVASGALPGFGKSQMHDPDLVERLREVLATQAAGGDATDESP